MIRWSDDSCWKCFNCKLYNDTLTADFLIALIFTAHHKAITRLYTIHPRISFSAIAKKLLKITHSVLFVLLTSRATLNIFILYLFTRDHLKVSKKFLVNKSSFARLMTYLPHFHSQNLQTNRQIAGSRSWNKAKW